MIIALNSIFHQSGEYNVKTEYNLTSLEISAKSIGRRDLKEYQTITHTNFRVYKLQLVKLVKSSIQYIFQVSTQKGIAEHVPAAAFEIQIV